MSKIPADLAAFILAALCVVAITLLAALGIDVPDVLPTIALVSAGAGGGASLPRARAAAAVPPAPAGVGVIAP